MPDPILLGAAIGALIVLQTMVATTRDVDWDPDAPAPEPTAEHPDADWFC